METREEAAYQEFVNSFRRNHPTWLEATDRFQRATDAWRRANREWNANGQLGPKPQLSEPRPAHTGHPRGRPSGYYNGMIKPVAPFALKGAI